MPNTSQKAKPRKQRAPPAARKKAEGKAAAKSGAEDGKKKKPAKSKNVANPELLKHVLSGIQRRNRLEPL